MKTPALRVFAMSAFIGGLALAANHPLTAECLISAPCEALRGSAYVFTADVVNATSNLEEYSPGLFRIVPQTVEFAVGHVFKGFPAEQQQVTAKIASGNPEETNFETGKRYLVYATRLPNGIWSTRCSRTMMIGSFDQMRMQEINDEMHLLYNCSRR